MASFVVVGLVREAAASFLVELATSVSTGACVGDMGWVGPGRLGGFGSLSKSSSISSLSEKCLVDVLLSPSLVVQKGGGSNHP